MKKKSFFFFSFAIPTTSKQSKPSLDNNFFLSLSELKNSTDSVENEKQTNVG